MIIQNIKQPSCWALVKDLENLTNNYQSCLIEKMNLNQLQWQCQQNLVAGISGLAETLKMEHKHFTSKMTKEFDIFTETSAKKSAEAENKILSKNTAFEKALQGRVSDLEANQANFEDSVKKNISSFPANQKEINTSMESELKALSVEGSIIF